MQCFFFLKHKNYMHFMNSKSYFISRQQKTWDDWYWRHFKACVKWVRLFFIPFMHHTSLRRVLAWFHSAILSGLTYKFMRELSFLQLMFCAVTENSMWNNHFLWIFFFPEKFTGITLYEESYKIYLQYSYRKKNQTEKFLSLTT